MSAPAVTTVIVAADDRAANRPARRAGHQDGVRRLPAGAPRGAGAAASAPVVGDGAAPTGRGAAALASGRPVVIPHLTDDDVVAMTADEESRAALAPLRVSAVATFPLLTRGELFGAFTLVNGSERGPHTATELRTAEIASRRAALALDDARLAGAAQRMAERLQHGLLSPPVQPERWSSPSVTGRPPAGSRSAATGTTRSCSPTATPCW